MLAAVKQKHDWGDWERGLGGVNEIILRRQIVKECCTFAQPPPGILALILPGNIPAILALGLSQAGTADPAELCGFMM